ncbi:hypothetical protein FGG08_007280 [Glutinoglossum americanum]|uniref:Uncharacterized protein n=1 Tax=Glutinoglossum americanum TaxID=1670608 RepID=A0A9P8HWN4_9PEZI|nr:hypothetical protein FGG08_007280 [Glutinoglossum americanum]
MPLYLIHAFRWPRVSIRIHIILNNLEDCASDWLMGPSGKIMTTSLHALHPSLSAQNISLAIFEQYDSADETRHTQDFAFVACEWRELGGLSARVDDNWGKGGEVGEAFEGLRSVLAPEERVEWWVVWCGEGRVGVSSAGGDSEVVKPSVSPSSGCGEKKGLRTFMKNIVLSPGSLRSPTNGHHRSPKDKFSDDEVGGSPILTPTASSPVANQKKDILGEKEDLAEKKKAFKLASREKGRGWRKSAAVGPLPKDTFSDAEKGGSGSGGEDPVGAKGEVGEKGKGFAIAAGGKTAVV